MLGFVGGSTIRLAIMFSIKFPAIQLGRLYKVITKLQFSDILVAIAKPTAPASIIVIFESNIYSPMFPAIRMKVGIGWLLMRFMRWILLNKKFYYLIQTDLIFTNSLIP